MKHAESLNDTPYHVKHSSTRLLLAAAGGHCKGVIEKEVAKIAGVATVSADPTSKDVVVCSLPAPRAVNLAAQDARVGGARGGVG